MLGIARSSRARLRAAPKLSSVYQSPTGKKQTLFLLTARLGSISRIVVITLVQFRRVLVAGYDDRLKHSGESPYFGDTTTTLNLRPCLVFNFAALLSPGA